MTGNSVSQSTRITRSRAGKVADDSKVINTRAQKVPQFNIHRVISSDKGSDADLNTEHMDFWVECYAEKEKKWIVIDPVEMKVNCEDHIRVGFILYVHIVN